MNIELIIKKNNKQKLKKKQLKNIGPIRDLNPGPLAP